METPHNLTCKRVQQDNKHITSHTCEGRLIDTQTQTNTDRQTGRQTDTDTDTDTDAKTERQRDRERERERERQTDTQKETQKLTQTHTHGIAYFREWGKVIVGGERVRIGL